MKNLKYILLVSIGIFFLQSLCSQCYPDRHSTDWFDSWVSCQESPSPNPANKAGHWIVYDLKDRYSIDKIKIWNINDPSHLDWGIRLCKVEYSGNYVDWFEAGELSLEKGTGKTYYEGMDWQDLRMPEARYILITALSNYGKEACYGFAEIKFSAEKTLVTSTDNVSGNKVLSATIAPNPVDQYFIAHIQSEESEMVEYRCVDMFGQVIDQGKIKMTQSNYLLKIYTDEWIPGQYRLLLKNSSSMVNLSVVKLK